MGLFSKKEKKLTPMEKIRYMEKIKKGWVTNVKLPEIESVGHGVITKGVATAAFGVVGLAMTMGSYNQQRKISAKIRFPDNGIIIEKGNIDGRDIKLPWRIIIGASKDQLTGINIELEEGQIINFLPYFSFNPKAITNFLIEYINEHAAGQIEDGWDFPSKPEPYHGITDEIIEKKRLQESKQYICMSCGNKLIETDRFCRNCGYEL